MRSRLAPPGILTATAHGTQWYKRPVALGTGRDLLESSHDSKAAK